MDTIKPIDFVNNHYVSLMHNGLFAKQWMQIGFQLALQIQNDGFEIVEALDNYTGGGCHHFHMRTNDGVNGKTKIYTAHSERIEESQLHKKGKINFHHYKWNYEVSFYRYKSIIDYYDDQEYGFGYEDNSPNYEERIFKMESIINT